MKVLMVTPHHYDVQDDVELPSLESKRLVEFSPSPSVQARKRCVVAFELDSGDGWIGRFVGDYDEPPAISLVCSAADPDRAFVVCAGRGYYVRVDRPDQFEVVRCFPVCSVEVVKETPAIIFGSFTHIASYGSRGLSWRSNALVSDDLRIVEANERIISIEGTNAPSGSTVRLLLESKTGKPISSRFTKRT